MVDVQAAPSFHSLSEAERQAALSFLLVSDHDAVLDGAWDPAQKDNQASQLATAPSSSEEGSSSSLSSTRSSSPFSGAQSPLASSLLIRSKWQGWERSFELHQDWPIPKLTRDDEVLIEHNMIGLNPVDFKSVLYNFGIPEAPWVLGRDISGVVAQVGKDVTNVKVGDRVWTCADARDVRSGAYQTYSVARSAVVGRTSSRIADQQAATLGTGLVTAAIAAYWFFAWPRATSLDNSSSPLQRKSPVQSASFANNAAEQDKPWLLIHGGGAITGIFIAQLARLSGLRTIAVASPENFDYLTSSAVGVTRCVDRYLSEDEIAEQVGGIVGQAGVDFVVDCVGAKTASLGHRVASSASAKETPAQMICLAGDPKSKDNAGPRAVTIHRISFSTTFYGDDTFAQALLGDLDALMQAGQLHAAHFELVPDGLAGVRRGLERLRDNNAPRACKLIVNVKDTPHAHSTNLGVRAELGWNGVV